MAEIKKLITLELLTQYHTGLKELMDNADENTLALAKQYFDDNSDQFDPAGKAQTLYELLKAEVDKNTEAIAAINHAETGLLKQAKDHTDTEVAKVQGEVDALEKEVGDLDTLETTAKEDLVKAINEVRNAVSVGGTAAAVTMDTTTTTEGALKSYTIKQGDNVVGTIDIPKDMVVESGEVVANPEGQAEGTYIKLVLANVAEPLFINVGTLVDIYKAKANATQLQLTIDSATREISAVIVAGSVGTTELADNAITTVKIADANVTLAKLSTTLQASIAKADASAAQTDLEAEVTRATQAEAKLKTDLEAYADSKVAGVDLSGIATNASDIDKLEESLAEGGATATAIANAKKAGDDAQADVDALELKVGTVTEGKTVVEMISDAKAEATYDDTEVRGLITDNDTAIDELAQTHATDKAALEESIQANADAIAGLGLATEAEIDALFAE